LKRNGSNGDSPPPGGGLSAAARVRTRAPDFSASFLALKDVVRNACAAETEWQARIAVGLRAVLEFAASDPAAARALTIQARRGDPKEADRQDQVLAYFAELLSEIAPAETRFAVSTDQGIVDSVATIVRGHLLGRTEDQLPGLAPELVYVALLRYTGFTEARRWASATPGL
jgi:hypothetical protein